MYKLYCKVLLVLLLFLAMGWANAGAEDAGTLAPPVGVVIGDSIAEGHPALHGRLHPGRVAFVADYASQPGQLSYELQALSGFSWYNQGIGSQTTEMIRTRWKRDVMGMQDDPKDGRGSQTLSGSASVVVVAAGVNDIALKVPESVTKANLEFLARSLNEAGIPAVFLTMPPSNKFTPDQITQVKNLNSWMLATLPAGNVKVVDLYAWFEDPQNPGKVNPTLAADYIHPSKEGYRQLAALAWASLEPAVVRLNPNSSTK